VQKQDLLDAVLDSAKRAEIASEPLLVPLYKANGTRSELELQGLTITRSQKEGILLGLQMIAGLCDRGKRVDGEGFSKVDVAIGHSLAPCQVLSDRQAALGKKLCLKYRRQLPEEVIERIA
jgi:hypothetical protein